LNLSRSFRFPFIHHVKFFLIAILTLYSINIFAVDKELPLDQTEKKTISPKTSKKEKYYKNDISFATGGAYNIPLPLIIRQDGYPKIRVGAAHYDTKPFVPPPYYDIRYSRWMDSKTAWELEFIHHKLYLSNTPQDVQEFTITNGYNLFFANMAFKETLYKSLIHFIWRFGVGPTFTHPESTIRNKRFDERGGLPWFDTDGYFVSGLAGQAAVEFDLAIFKMLNFFVEGKFIPSFSTVPINSGRADVYTIGLHGVFGLKASF